MEEFHNFGLEKSRIVAEDLDDNLAIDLRNRFQDVIADGLRERRLDSRQGVQGCTHLGNQVFLRNVLSPFRHGF